MRRQTEESDGVLDGGIGQGCRTEASDGGVGRRRREELAATGAFPPVPLGLCSPSPNRSRHVRPTNDYHMK